MLVNAQISGILPARQNYRNKPIKLHSSKDLAKITELAQKRKHWRGLTSQIEKAAEVSQTKKCDAKLQ